MFKRLREDIRTVRQRDPAARTAWEVLLCYPSVHALFWYRFAHWLFGHHCLWLARYVSQRTRRRTGIEIHPGATLGRRIFIDHGTGVVIGETTVIGDDCTLYQGVTLGGTGKECGKRHPTLGNNVMVGAGAKLLGAFTVGDNAKIAAGAVVLGDVPADSTAVGIPARIAVRDGVKVKERYDLDQVHIPDPVAEEIARIKSKLAELEEKLGEKE